MKEIIFYTNRLLKVHPTTQTMQAKDTYVGWWWFCWIAGGIISRISSRLYLQNDSLKAYEWAMMLDVIASVFLLFAGVLVIQIIKGYAPAEDAMAELDITPSNNLNNEKKQLNFRT